MKRLLLACTSLLAFSVLFVPAWAADQAAPAQPAAKLPQVRVKTTMGSFVIELNPERAPLSVANFLEYVRAGHYNGTIFHRVVANFVAQGGGYDTQYVEKPTRPAVPNESGNGLSNLRGTVGMARAASPHSSNAQFYVNLVDNPSLDPQPTRWGYAVFGRVVEGMSVLDDIGNVPTGAAGPLKEYVPAKQVVIQSIEVIDDTAAPKPAKP
jgi:cyclophilin family peptidyl-prolyl cis-trans isomerase